jgi:hypothetical protein
MRLTFLILTIAGLSMAAAPVWTSTKILIDNISDKEKKIPAGGTCKKDGSMGNCQSGLCVVCFEQSTLKLSMTAANQFIIASCERGHWKM